MTLCNYRWLLAALPILMPAAAAGQLPPAPDGDQWFTQELDVQVPLDLTFQDEAGNAVRLRDLMDGRPVILNLVYYECPMLCNVAMRGLVQSLRTLRFDAGDEFTVITVSFDPRETPELAAAAKRTAMKRYGRAEAESHWHFLTGKEDAIRQLTETVGFHFQYDPTTGQYKHAAGLIVLTPQGRTSRYLMGVEYPARDLRLSLVEASQNKIGSITDQLLLLCYHYDPATGKYSLLIESVLRIAGVATLAGIGGLVGVMLIRERSQQRRARCKPAGH